MKKFLLITSCAITAITAEAGNGKRDADVDAYARQYFIEAGYIEPTRGEKIDRIYEQTVARPEREQRAETTAALIFYIWQQMTPEQREQFVHENR